MSRRVVLRRSGPFALAGRLAGWFVLMAWRFASGQPMDGRRRTDASFWHPGTGAVAMRMTDSEAFWSATAGRPATRWSLRAGWDRAARRLGTATALWVLLYGSRTARAVLGLAVLVAAGYGVLRAVQAVRQWQHMRDVVMPLHITLGKALGLPATLRPEDWLTVPVDYRSDPETTVRVQLPEDWAGDANARKAIVSIVVGKLSGEWDSAFHMAGRPYVSFRPAPTPPARVGLAELRPLMEAAPEPVFILGIGIRDSAVSINFDDDSPHLAVSAGSGGGKSTIAKVVNMQVLRKGGQAVFLDGKRNSHKWARGLPGVTYYRDTAEIHDALVRLGEEMDRRQRVTDELDDDPGFPRIAITFEEMNMVTPRLIRHWAAIKEKEDPKMSPALEALADISFAGRNVKMNLVGIAQKLTAKTFGMPGGEPRENFSYKLLARYQLPTWKMLAPEVWPAPKSTDHPGRAQLVGGGRARAVQIGNPSDSEAIEWATSGVRQHGTVTVSGDPGDLGEEAVTVTDRPHLSVVEDDGQPQRYTLKEAIEKGIIRTPDGEPASIKYDALRQAKSRDPEFPDGEKRGKSDTFTAEELNRWYRNRPRAVS